MKRVPFDFVQAGGRPPQEEQQPDFDEFEATELYCPKCGRAVPVRKSLLLILPEGDKYEYTCAVCGSSVGDKIDKSGQFYGILKT
ncbi:MAG: cytoplasmic protein [Deltaproteobacteria bacterium]|nr:cytoplasmic protein [Deltaproteobacteria bacterium]MBW1920115.1 cytoplasmic protein [Deltaproteobacteria bacterium]MBW1936350.1 cytoplasmic protein [Deltaproteobacteria bacterium]MBW1979132.1 cytoplasmic protein [Deltaproteobacteria bacterium]MBW2298818.1 cytoplasmic protein [Deltaproteobacteria bacterium]